MTTETKTHRTSKDKAEGQDTRPLTTIRQGAIAASIWRRQTSTGFEYLDYSLSRSWKTKDGEKEGYSQNFFDRNEEALVEVIREASEFIRDHEIQSQIDGESPNGVPEHADLSAA